MQQVTLGTLAYPTIVGALRAEGLFFRDPVRTVGIQAKMPNLFAIRAQHIIFVLDRMVALHAFWQTLHVQPPFS